jgi:hypothetical protein
MDALIYMLGTGCMNIRVGRRDWQGLWPLLINSSDDNDITTITLPIPARVSTSLGLANSLRSFHLWDFHNGSG